MTESERFWSKVDKTATCWLWTGTLVGGYGTFRSGATVRAHRWSYEHLIGPIPEGLHLDHLCRVRQCVNPAHLEPVTQRENNRRGEGWSGQKARQTQCLHGHPLSGDNLRIRPNGHRECKACSKARYRAWWLRQQEALSA
jgi:hypothetical protein